MHFNETIDLVGRAVDALGVALVVVGTLWALALYGRGLLRSDDRLAAYKTCRRNIGRSILLGLEVLVAADIIRTVAIEPTLTGIAVLGGIVLIRTFLSLSLETEIAGRLPWRRAEDAAK